MRMLIHTLLAAVFGLGLTPMAFAQSGTLSASPAIVVIPIGGSLGHLLS